MGAYIGVCEGFGSGDEDTSARRLEQIRSYDPALESAYREIAELKEKLAQEKRKAAEAKERTKLLEKMHDTLSLEKAQATLNYAVCHSIRDFLLF